MSAVFADAFYFIAWLNARDSHHSRVASMSRTLRAKFVTTDWVLMEVADALATLQVRTRVREFILLLRESSTCEVVTSSQELFDRGLQLYHQHKDKEWTLTDCISFVVMRDKGLVDALTYDHHFVQAGFTALFR